jgi:sensor histidine kinase regulating citrate/malate metabolism
MENGAYISSKQGPRRKGIGISSICYCAEKYQGSVEITAEDHVFTLRVTMPVFS